MHTPLSCTRIHVHKCMHTYTHTRVHTHTHTHTYVHTRACAHTHKVEMSEDEGPLGEEEESDDEQLLTGKIGTKKLRKIQAKAERKAQREVSGLNEAGQVHLDCWYCQVDVLY